MCNITLVSVLLVWWARPSLLYSNSFRAWVNKEGLAHQTSILCACALQLTTTAIPGLLSGIINSCPHVALESPPQLKEAFAYLNLLSPAAAIELLHAVLVISMNQ